MKKNYFLLLALSCCMLHSSAQVDAKKLAYNAYDKKDWATAESNFQQYLKINASDTFAVYCLGMAQLQQSKYKEALNNFRELYELDLSPGTKNELRFEQAKIYAALHDTSKCFQLLEAAAKDGANYNGRLKDTLFTALQNTNHFTSIAEKFKENATPCLYDEKFHWLGSDYVGESISFYDNTAQRFRMCWAGKSGDIRNFEEIYSAKDSIILLAVTVSDSKRNLLHRRMTITYNPSNETLHEYIENSYDLGKTWEPDFDALFKKVKQ